MMQLLGSVTLRRRFRLTAALTFAMHFAMLALAPLADAALEVATARSPHRVGKLREQLLVP